MKIELVNCETTLLEEIGDKALTRQSIAMTYALTLRSDERTRVDWGKVNKAIIKRWSTSALDYIKRTAWSGRCFARKETETK